MNHPEINEVLNGEFWRQVSTLIEHCESDT